MTQTQQKNLLHLLVLRLLASLYHYKLLHQQVTPTCQAKGMNLSPSLSYSLKCPKRFSQEQQRIPTIATFASSHLGREVHKRIAQSLKQNQVASTTTLNLPRRIILQENETLSELETRAQNALEFFNNKCLSYLKQNIVTHIEHKIETIYQLKKSTLTLTGVIDCIIKTPNQEHIIDWKTSSATYSQNQLRFYLMLRQLETKQAPKSAEAISLSQQNSHNETSTSNLEDWFKTYLEQMQQDLKASQTQQAKSGKHCKYCPYAHTCDNSEAPKRQLLDTWTGEVSHLG